MWLLLLPEIEDKIAAAIDNGFAWNSYSTLDAVFFVAANVWLLIFIYLCCRVRKLSDRISELD